MINNPTLTPWYKQRWPWLLISGPAIVVVAGFITFWLAFRSNDGLVTDDYYKQGLAVNQSLQRDHQAASMGLHAELMTGGQSLRMFMTGQQALPEKMTVKLAHPTRSGQDQVVEMKAEAPGLYGGKLAAGELAGRWIVTVEDGAGNWRLQGDWKVDSGEPLRLGAKAGN